MRSIINLIIAANTHTATDAENLKTLAVILICTVAACIWIGNLIDKIPEGYEDMFGFHKGKQPTKKIYTERDPDDWNEWDVK